MAQPFLGQITVFPYNFAPYGWLDCAGQLLPISQYSALFSLLGTTYGGNGTSNFGLPDLQGRIPVGQGQLTGGSDYAMGEAAGAENVTLLITNMPAHSHGLGAIEVDGTTNNPSGKVLAKALRTRPPRARSIIRPRRIRPWPRPRSAPRGRRCRTTTSSPRWCCAIASPCRASFRRGDDAERRPERGRTGYQ